MKERKTVCFKWQEMGGSCEFNRAAAVSSHFAFTQPLAVCSSSCSRPARAASHEHIHARTTEGVRWKQRCLYLGNVCERAWRLDRVRWLEEREREGIWTRDGLAQHALHGDWPRLVCVECAHRCAAGWHALAHRRWSEQIGWQIETNVGCRSTRSSRHLQPHIRGRMDGCYTCMQFREGLMGEPHPPPTRIQMSAPLYHLPPLPLPKCPCKLVSIFLTDCSDFHYRNHSKFPGKSRGRFLVSIVFQSSKFYLFFLCFLL